MKILIADDDFVSRAVLEATLKKWGHETITAGDGDEALAVLQSADAPPLAILDWIMPGLSGVEICSEIRRQPSSAPPYIILLTAKNEKTDIVAGLESGADDYLTKPFERSEMRARIEVGIRLINTQKNLSDRVEELNQALAELKKAEAEILNLSMTDELTGLYNRRGFLTLTEQQQKMARRTKNSFSLVYADMDGLKRINDTLGHQEGSRALQRIAEILKISFRESDIIGRLGGDEFTICVPDTIAESVSVPLDRLTENLEQYNRRKTHDYELSLSIGSICVCPEDETSIETLLVTADQIMYENKRQKRAERQT